MTFPVWTEIVCRNCSRSGCGEFTYKGSISIRKLRNEAKAKGWVFSCNDVFCCKKCEQEHLDKLLK